MPDSTRGPAGWRVWVTRPDDFAGPLCRKIGAAGGQPVHVPLVGIVAVHDEAARGLLSSPGPGDSCIFVSRNAVRCAAVLCPDLPAKLRGVTVHAVGAGTAAELSGLGVVARTGPGPAYGAADLLSVAELGAEVVRGRTIIIVRGVGGEPLLADTLRERGATVRIAEVYRREPLVPDAHVAESLWRDTAPDIIALTSAGAVAVLVKMTPPAFLSRLLRTPLAVISDRVARSAQNAGFTGRVAIADGATDDAMMEAIHRCQQDLRGQAHDQ